MPRYIMEGRRRRPVLTEVDVAVAGAGLCGVFAAIAAARCGARTLVIDRMPALGGNIGPGMILGGTLDGEADTTLPGGLSGIAQEFMTRLIRLRAAGPRDHRLSKAENPAFRSSAGSIYPEDAGIASWLLAEMLREAGGEAILSAYVADPILRGKTVKGLFVECKGGRRAVLAKVTVDGTGDADLARRAGAPIQDYLPISPGVGVDPRYKTPAAPEGMIRDAYMKRQWPTYYNDTNALVIVGGVNEAGYRAFLERSPRMSAPDRKIADKHFRHFPKPYRPALARAWRRRELPFWREIVPGTITSSGIASIFRYGPGVAAFWLTARGAMDPSNPLHVSRIEAGLRDGAFRCVRFLRENIGGFENAWLLATNSFLGFRGGPHIRGEHTLTIAEMFTETRFDDALYRNIHESNHGGPKSGFDVPYRCVLPKGIGGLLVCGRGAAYERRGHDPTGMRARPSMMVLGQAVGTAAALVAKSGADTRRPPIRKIQKRLSRDGVVLGEKER